MGMKLVAANVTIEARQFTCDLPGCGAVFIEGTGANAVRARESGWTQLAIGPIDSRSVEDGASVMIFDTQDHAAQYLTLRAADKLPPIPSVLPV